MKYSGLIMQCFILTVDIKPNKPNGFSHPYTLGESISHLRGGGVRCIFSLCSIFVIENPVSKQ